jgi:hypothetical protein
VSFGFRPEERQDELGVGTRFDSGCDHRVIRNLFAFEAQPPGKKPSERIPPLDGRQKMRQVNPKMIPPLDMRFFVPDC